MRGPKTRSEFPPGWDDLRVKEAIAYYDAQSAEDEADEIEELVGGTDFKLIRVPVPLVPKVQALLNRKRGPAADGFKTSSAQTPRVVGHRRRRVA